MDKIREEAEKEARNIIGNFSGTIPTSLVILRVANAFETILREKAKLEKKLEVAREALDSIAHYKEFDDWLKSESEIAEDALKTIEAKE